MRFSAFLLLLSLCQVPAKTSFFLPVNKSEIPRELVESNCHEALGDCWGRFVEFGQAWAGDVNHDGKKEIIIFPGTGGTGGEDAVLYQKKGESWVQLLDYFPYDTRFLILPKLRSGYSDLCLDNNHCFKWEGNRYAGYQPEDYRALSLSDLDTRNPREATLRWMAGYAGLSSFQLEPDWYFVDPNSNLGIDLGMGKGKSRAVKQIEDKDTGLRWVALYKAGVWGVKERQAFLIFPRNAHTGTEEMALEGDWLIIRVGGDDGEEIARYNRISRVLQVRQADPFWMHRIDR